jgi:hypothetical protein
VGSDRTQRCVCTQERKVGAACELAADGQRELG